MDKRIIDKTISLIVVAICCFVNLTTAQENSTEFSSKIVDNSGNPLEGVQIIASKGNTVTSDADGNFTLPDISLDNGVVIRKEGYDEAFVVLSEFPDPLVLNKSLFLASDDDIIDLGIKSISKRGITGAITSITTNDRMVFDNTQSVRDYIGGLMLGVRGSSNIRGFGNALFVIDGVVGRSPDILNMDEVEEITVLRDVSAVALYGSQAQNGVIVINTKRGAVNSKTSTINIRNGIRTPVAYPNFLGAVDYMELFNEARANDGLDPFFNDELIANYRSSDNSFLYPDVDFYSDPGYLKNAIQTTDIVGQFSGGNDKAQFYVSLGWNFDESLVKLNSEANNGANRFNVRGNVDFKVNSWIKSTVDVVAVVDINKTSNTNILNSAATFKPTEYSPLLPISSITDEPDETLRGILNTANTFDGFLLGTTQANVNNIPVAEALAAGQSERISRVTQFNNSINFDLSMITDGLSAKTYLSFDFVDQYTEFLSNDFRVYEPTWQNGEIIALTPFGDPDLQDLTENVRTNQYQSRLGFYGLLNYKKTFSEHHSINTTLLGFLNTQEQDQVLQTDKHAHTALQVSYDFKKKIFVDIAATYANSIKLAEGNRGGLSPTVGLGYIISEEGFMDNVGFIDYLKLKASGGLVKSDIGIDRYFLYDQNYRDGGFFTWADVNRNRTQNIIQGENLSLTFEERFDINAGIEAYFLNSLWLEMNVFRTNFDNQLTQLNNRYPSYYDVFRPFTNFNNDLYEGFEIGLNYSKKFKNDFSFSLGGNLLYSQSEVVERDEVIVADNLSRIGKPRDVIFGLVDDGFYSENDFNTNESGNLVLNENLPVPAFGRVQPGDIKYIDQNNDGIINDDDNQDIGQFGNPRSYGVNFRVKFKGLSLFVLGSGQSGGQQVSDSDYFWVDGNDKYSEVVLNRWTPATASTATFPRLSSVANNNNFRRSTFWLYDNSFFTINRAQLTYELDKMVCEKLGLKKFSINLAGSNLMQFAKNKDIRELELQGNPQFRTLTFGLRTTF